MLDLFSKYQKHSINPQNAYIHTPILYFLDINCGVDYKKFKTHEIDIGLYIPVFLYI